MAQVYSSKANLNHCELNKVCDLKTAESMAKILPVQLKTPHLPLLASDTVRSNALVLLLSNHCLLLLPLFCVWGGGGGLVFVYLYSTELQLCNHLAGEKKRYGLFYINCLLVSCDC